MQRYEEATQKLIINTFDIRVFVLVFNKLTRQNINMPKRATWHNIIRDYDIDTIKVTVEHPLHESQYNCITLGGLYYLVFGYWMKYLNQIGYRQFNEWFHKFRERVRGIYEFSNFIITRPKGYWVCYENAFSMSDEFPKSNVFEFEPVNDIIRELIQTDTITLQKSNSGFFWRINEEESVCQLVHLLSQYLPS